MAQAHAFGRTARVRVAGLEGELEVQRAEVELIDVTPHMHYLGREVEAYATLPDGEQIPLIKIDDWDFRWQDSYVFRTPLRLPKGTRMEALFRFDNSERNPFNPSSPPRRVLEGWQTTDEMWGFRKSCG